MSLSIERPSLVDPQDPTRAQPGTAGGRPLFGDSGPSFGDLLDMVNPLQHLPIVGTIYRALTGDAISDGARLAGGALFGGPVGLALAMADLGVEQATGRNVGAAVLAALTGQETTPDTPPKASTQVAAAEAEMLAQAAPAAGPPSAPARDLPQLSPEAFDALMRSVNRSEPAPAPAKAAARAGAPPSGAYAQRGGSPAVSPAALDALNLLPGAPVAASPGARQAGLELHDALRAYAERRGLAPGR